MKTFLCAAALLATAIPVSGQAAVPSVDPHAATVLASVRTAMLHRPLRSLTSIHIGGTLTQSGLRGSSQEWDDLTGLTYVGTAVGGPLTGSNGWDGKNAWNADANGQVHIDSGKSSRIQNIDQAYLDSFAFLAPDAHGATVAYSGAKSEAGKRYDVVNVSPVGGTPFDLWVDTTTHLIAKEVGVVGLTTVTITLSDYRTAHGVTYPYALSTVTSDGNTQSTAISSFEVNVPGVRARTAVPASSNHDATVEGASTTAPIQIVNNHIYLQAMVDGKGPFTFILDTGGALIISPELAATLKTGSAGSAQIGGVGDATEAAGFTKIDTLQVGKATMRDQYSLVLPIDKGFGVAEGLHIDGMVGYEFVARFLTTIDYGDSTITLAPLPKHPAVIANATALPFVFDVTIPQFPIVVDGIAANGEFDSGSRGSLTLTSPFAAANPKIAADVTTADGVAGFGIGGPSLAKLGRANSLQIGAFRFANPIIAVTTQAKGAFADPLAPQNVGGDIWKRFTVTFDYPHYQVLLAPNAAYGTTFTYDRSGLFVIDNGGVPTVLGVRAGTAGAGAGLAKGDAILAVDGAPTTGITLAQLRTLLMGPAGTVVHLHVKNATGERDATLTLHDYV